MKILKIADFYGSVQQRLSIDGRVFQVGVDVGGLEFHDYRAKAVVAAHYGDTRFPDPIAVIKQVAARTMGERENILVDRLPGLVAESLRLGIVCHEHIALLHHRASLDANSTILPRQLLVERCLENCDFIIYMFLDILSRYVSTGPFSVKLSHCPSKLMISFSEDLTDSISDFFIGTPTK